MTGSRALAAALAAWALLAAGGAAAQDAAPAAPAFEEFLTEGELRAAFTGADTGGCYPDREPVEERTAADGALYDLLQAGAPRVGDWWVEGREICYRYTGDHGHRPGTFCWNVTREGRELHFFSAPEGIYGGSTHCVDLVS